MHIYSWITNETGRERTQQTKWPAPLLKRQQVLYGHILHLEKSIPLWMATFDDNLNQPVPPGNSKSRGSLPLLWFWEVGFIAREKECRVASKSCKTKKIGTGRYTRPKLVEENIYAWLNGSCHMTNWMELFRLTVTACFLYGMVLCVSRGIKVVNWFIDHNFYMAIYYHY